MRINSRCKLTTILKLLVSVFINYSLLIKLFRSLHVEVISLVLMKSTTFFSPMDYLKWLATNIEREIE